MIRSIPDSISSFVASLLLDQYEIHVPITTEDAAYTMTEWSRKGVDIPSGLTPEAFAAEWNRQLAGIPADDGENTITNKEEDTTMATRVACSALT